MPFSLTITACACLAIGLLGSIVLWSGLRGRRIDDHPICRRCGYDLFGAAPDRTVCSECGADLTRRRARRLGHRRRRRGRILLGLLILLPVLAVGSGSQYLRIKQIDPIRYTPAWVLSRSVLGSHDGRRNEAADELLRRMSTGQLSQSQIDSLMDRLLAAQADLSRPWSRRWGEMIEAAYRSGRLTGDRWRTYLLQGFIVTLEVRPRVRRGDPMPMALRLTPGRITDFNLYIVIADVISFDGAGLRWEESPEEAKARAAQHANVARTQPLGMPFRGPVIFYTYSDGQISYELHFLALTDSQWSALPDGPQTVKIRAGVEVSTRPDQRWSTDADLIAPLTLLPASESSVALVDDPALRPQIEKALNAGTYLVHPRRHPSVQLTIPPLPIDLAYELSIRAGGEETPLGWFIAERGKRTDVSLGGYKYLRGHFEHVKSVDVIFRPAPALATRTIDIDRIWGGTVEVRNVPVQAETSPPPTSPVRR